MKKFLFFLIAIAGLAIHTYAAQYTWNGSINTNWATAGNWTPSGVPSTGDTVIISIASSQVVLDMNRNIARLQFTAASTLHLNGFTLTVDTSIRVSGNAVIDNGTFSAGTLIGDGLDNCRLQNLTTQANIVISSETWTNMQNSTFNGRVSYTHTGLVNYSLAGNNTYNDIVRYKTEQGRFRPELNSSIFNGDTVYFINNSTLNESIFFARDQVSTVNSHIRVECSSTGYIRLGSNGSSVGGVLLGNGFTITASNFATGSLVLHYFTQLGTTPQNITLTGDAELFINDETVFNAPVTFVAPRFRSYTATYNNTVLINKNGAGNDNNSGGNVFNGLTQITNSGSGALIFGWNLPDTFNLALTAINSGSSSLRFANSSANNVFAATVAVNNIGSGDFSFSRNASASSFFSSGIVITSNSTGTTSLGESGGSSTLSSGQTISLGGPFNSGTLYIRNLTQLGATAQNLTLSGTATLTIYDCIWNGNVIFESSRLTTRGTMYNGTASLTKTGSGNDASAGNNIFNGVATLTNTGSDYFLMGNGNPDIFNSTLTASATSSGHLYLAYNSAGNQFNGTTQLSNTWSATIYISSLTNSTSVFNANILLHNTSSGDIRFGSSGGSTQLSNTFAFSLNTLFNAGTLYLRNVTQIGTTAQNLTLSGTATLTIYDCIWNGNVSFSSPGITTRGTTYNGTASLTKTGSSNDDSAGGNTYNGLTTLTNNGTGRMRLNNTNSLSDDYNANVTFVRTSSGALEPAYNNPSYFAADININSTGILTFGASSGWVVLDGNGLQALNDASGSSATPTFRRLEMNKTAGDFTLNMPLNISIQGNFLAGIVISSNSNLLNFADNATAVNMSNLSFVSGPVRKTGNDAFTFPVGKNNLYRPVSISAPANTAHHFTAEFFYDNPNNPGYNTGSMQVPINNVSLCEYWMLDRTNGTSNVFVTLSWDSVISCGVGNYLDLLVARWNGTQWVSHGGANFTGNNSSGTLSTSAAVTSFSPFTLSSFTNTNPLPIELLSFYAEKAGEMKARLHWTTATEKNNEYFTLEHSPDGKTFKPFAYVPGAENSSDIRSYQAEDNNPFAPFTYYRLKQTDVNGDFSYSEIIALKFSENPQIELYPNPLNENKILSIRGLPNDETIHFSVYCSAGKLVYSTIINTNKSGYIDLSLADILANTKGMFFVTLIGETTYYSQKILR